MAKSDGLVELIRSALAAHNREWEERRQELRLHKDLYGSRFWAGTTKIKGNVRVETGDGPAHVESYLGALFSRSPAVEVGEDLSLPDADAKIPQTVANAWLMRQRSVFERATRVGLIYPMAFLRVGPVSSKRRRKPCDAVEVQSVAPWDVILDVTAPDWEHLRWIGHRYTLPLDHAKARFPGATFKPRAEPRFWDKDDRNRRREQPTVPERLQNVTIVEFYDLVGETVTFWSADKDYGESAIKTRPIPLHRPGTQEPIHPIVPLYFQYEPDQPILGISTIARLYDQFREKNLLRTNAANCIRRDSRQHIAKPALGVENATKLTAGVDGTVVFVDETYQGRLEELIVAVPVAPMSSNFDKYSAAIEGDLEKGSVLASFTRGEPAGGRTSAKEIGVLAEYTASNVGKMARERDAAIEAVAELYLAHLVLAAGDVTTAQVAGKVVNVTAAMLDAKWVITALDQAGTPMSRALEQQQFLLLLPQLIAMQIPIPVLVAQLVRLELLPPEFLEEAKQPPAPGTAPQLGAPSEPGARELSDEELLQLAARSQ